MKTMSRITILILIIIAIISCNKTEVKEHKKISRNPAPVQIVNVDSITELDDDFSLNIISAKPTGRVYTDNPTIVIMFSHDIIPLSGQMKSDTSSIININPPLSGIYHWKGTRIVEFTPTGKLDLNTEYTITIRKGVTSYDKTHVLKNDYVFSFVNKGFRYIGTYVDSNCIYETINKSFPSTQAIYVKFNYPVKASSLKNSFVMKDWSKSNIKIKAEVMPNKPNIVRLQFPQGLKKENDYILIIKSTLLSDYGDCGLENDIKITVFTDKVFTLIEYPKEIVPPNDYIKVRFSNPINRNNKNFIIIDEYGDTVYNKYIYKRYTGENNYDISFKLKAATKYKVIFPKGYKDYNGNEMQKEFVFTFKTGDYESRFSLPGHNILLENYLSRKIPLNSVNCDSIYVSVRDIDSKKFIFTDYVKCNTSRNVYETVPLEFGKFVNNKPGLYVLNILKHRTERIHKNYYVCLSNAAMMVKLSPSGMLVLVYDLKTGKPIKNARVRFKDFTGTTDKNGICRFTFKCSTKERTYGFGYDYPVFYEKNNDKGGIILTGSGDWHHFNAYFPPNFLHNKIEDYYRTKVFLYNDRGLYKPGETVYIKIMHRYLGNKGLKRGNNKEVNVTVYNSRREQILKKKLPLNNYGNALLTINIPKDAPTGQYYAIVNVSKLSHEYNYFRVEEFKPLEFKVDIKSAKEHIVKGDSTIVAVQANYMYGAPMSMDTVFWSIVVFPYQFKPKGYSEYTFADGGRFYMKKMISGFGIIDENGFYDIKEQPDLKGIHSTARILFKARVKSMSGQEISKSINVLYHPMDRYLGIRATKYFYSNGEKPVISVVCMDYNGNKLNMNNVKLTLIRYSYYSVQKSGTGGRLYWENETIIDTVLKKNISSYEGDYTFTVQDELKSGYYKVVAQLREDEQTYKTSCNFYKAGVGKVYWNMRNDNYIELIADKGSEDYVPGDTAKILIKSPITGCKAFISIEREDIIKYFTIDIKSTVEVINIPIEESYYPNVYISAYLYKGREKEFTEKDSIDMGKPKYGVGYCTLNVNSESKKLTVNIKTESTQYEPQDSVHIDINIINANKRGEKAELSVAVVDLGVLNLIGYDTPDPLSYFYKNRANSVSMFTNSGDVIGERNYGEKGETRGGSGADERFRAEFLSLVYYKGDIITDDNGHASIAIKLPDNLTTFRIIVVANNANKFGSNDYDFTVSKTIMLTPNLPSFLRPGDEFKGGFIAVNNADETFIADIKTNTEKIISNKQSEQITLPGQQRKPVYFIYKAENVLNDSCRFKFSINANGYNDNLLITIPYKNPPITHENALCGTTEKNTKHFVKKPQSYIKNSLKLEIGLSSTGLNDIKEATSYLFKYPYGCLEQQTSIILPYILLKREIIKSFNIINMSNREMDNIVNKYLRDLKSYQKSDGGFGIWPNSKYSSPYLSCYVCLIMHYAEIAGYRINKTVKEKSLKYMENIVNGRAGRTFYWDHYSENTKRTVKLMALGVMAMNGKNVRNYIGAFKQYIETMNTEQLMYFIMALDRKRDKSDIERINRRLTGMLSVESRTVHFNEIENDPWIYSSAVKNTASGLMALLMINGKKTPYAYQLITWMLRERTNNRWKTTQENAYALMAISQYYNVFESEKPNFSAKVLFNGIKYITKQFKGYDAGIYNYSIPDSMIDNETAVEFKKTGKGMLYYQMMLSFVPDGKKLKENYGFEISKTIEPVNKNTKGFVKGEKYKITLRVKTPKDRIYVVVDDPLPAGFEVINSAFKNNEKINDGNNYHWYYGFNHKEIYFDRVLLFADYLTKGTHEYTYIVRANFSGKFHMPQTKISEMYTPEVFGTTAGDIIIIK